MSQTEIEQLRDRITQLEAAIADLTGGARRPAQPPAAELVDSGAPDGTPEGASRRHLLRAAAAAAGAAAIASVATSGEAHAVDPNDLELGAGLQVTSGHTEANYSGTTPGAAFLFQVGTTLAPTNSAFMLHSSALVGASTHGTHWTGVLGYSEAGGGRGVCGAATGSSSIGVRGEGPTGVDAVSTTSTGTAIIGAADGGYGVRGTSVSSIGVVGNSSGSTGVYGSGTIGVRGEGATEGVHGEGLGVGNGVQGNAAGAGYGVVGTSASGAGVHGTGLTVGVLGMCGTTGTGVEGRSTDGVGTFGTSTSTYGVAGISIDQIGVYGEGAVGGVQGNAGSTGTGVSGDGRVGVAATGSDYAFAVTGAGRSGLRLSAATHTSGMRAAPSLRTDTHDVGELDMDANGDLWWCVAAGTPGTWRKLSGPSSAGAFHAVTPGRVYDSRVATPGPIAPLAAGAERTVSVRDRRSTVDGSVTLADFVPAGATAIAANVTVVDTVGAGFLTANPGGVHDVNAATINWSASGQILNNGVILTLDAGRELNVIAGGGTGTATHFVIDVTGYYR